MNRKILFTLLAIILNIIAFGQNDPSTVFHSEDGYILYYRSSKPIPLEDGIIFPEERIFFVKSLNIPIGIILKKDSLIKIPAVELLSIGRLCYYTTPPMQKDKEIVSRFLQQEFQNMDKENLNKIVQDEFPRKAFYKQVPDCVKNCNQEVLAVFKVKVTLVSCESLGADCKLEDLEGFGLKRFLFIGSPDNTMNYLFSIIL
jgi:hypothetical protein